MAVAPRGIWVIIASFFAAAAFVVAPLPSIFDWLRPDWLALVLIYWCIALPHRVGIFSGFALGLCMDVIRGGLLGQYAASYTVIAFISAKMYRRMRNFPVWQQAITVFIILIIGQAVIYWIKGFIDEPVDFKYYWIPSIVGLIVWPLVYLFLRAIRRYFHVQ